MSSEIIKHLDDYPDDELAELYKDLIGYAEYRLKFTSTQGISAEDFVGRVIRKVLDEDSDDHRAWDPNTNPDLAKFLKGCISSEISNHFDLMSTTQTHYVENENSDDSFFDLLTGDDGFLEQIEGNELRNKLFEELIEIDEELADLLFIQDNGGYSAKEIAQKLNYDSASKVYNARKRLRRACEKIINKVMES